MEDTNRLGIKIIENKYSVKPDEWCESEEESDSDSDSVDIRSISSASWDCTDDDEGEF